MASSLARSLMDSSLRVIAFDIAFSAMPFLASNLSFSIASTVQGWRCRSNRSFTFSSYSSRYLLQAGELPAETLKPIGKAFCDDQGASPNAASHVKITQSVKIHIAPHHLQTHREPAHTVRRVPNDHSRWCRWCRWWFRAPPTSTNSSTRRRSSE